MEINCIRRSPRGLVAADLVVPVGGVEVKYGIYLQKDITLKFASTDRGRAELAANFLKLMNVDAEVKRMGGRDVWYVLATTDRIAAGRRELRDAVAEIVRAAAAAGWIDAARAERWLRKLERGLTLKEGWPKYGVGLVEGALVVRYSSTDRGGIEREARRFRAMGLEEGRHFTVKMPEGGREGYVSILKDGLIRAAWLSIHGSGDQQKLAAEFVEYILQRAREEGEDVRKKAEEVVDRGREVGSLRLTDVKGAEVLIEGRRHVVSVLGGGAQPERGRSGRTLLRIKITAEVDGVRGDYTITFGRLGAGNAAKGRAVARADAPEGRETYAERLSALIKVLTGREPWVHRMKDGRIMIECGREHLDGFALYAELYEAIERWFKWAPRS